MKEIRKLYFFVGVIFFFFGFTQILSSFSGINGFIVFEERDVGTANIVGVYSVLFGIVFIALSKRKRGQAAMEFLMTYGWAILAAIIAIGVLAYFGVFNFTPPTTLLLGLPFQGEGFAFDISQSQLLIEVKNVVYDSTRRIKSYVLENSNIICPDVTGQDIPVQSGDTVVLIFDNCVGLSEGMQFKGDIVIGYTDPGSSLEKISSGTISGELHDVSEGGGGNGQDSDGDGVEDDLDNCVNDANQNQTNSDTDSFGDVCDNCPSINNEGQEDLDGDQIGDVCDSETCGNGELEGGEECDDGNQISGDRCGSICEIEYYRVFVTSSTYNGNLGGVSGADSKCQLASANNPNLSGTWKAWISSSGNTASDRLIHSPVEYKLINGQTKIADSWNDLTDGTLDALINMTEYGQFIGAGNVWTGTNITGTETSSNCLNWIDSTLIMRGDRGLTSSTLFTWTINSPNQPCASLFRLYCFEQT